MCILLIVTFIIIFIVIINSSSVGQLQAMHLCTVYANTKVYGHRSCDIVIIYYIKINKKYLMNMTFCYNFPVFNEENKAQR